MKKSRRFWAVFLAAVMLLTVMTVPTVAQESSDDNAEDVRADMAQVGIFPVGTPEARLCTPLGLRYVTALSKADYEALTADENVKAVRVGTLIAPEATVKAAGALTKEALAAGTYLDVAATAGEWYDSDAEYVYFAGSIANIKEENYNLALCGVGYLEVELQDGTTYTVYAEDTVSKLPVSSLAVASTVGLRAEALTDLQINTLDAFATAMTGGEEMLYQQDFDGLNVLAIGDSLFYGAYETVGDKVWVNLLGKRYAWNLTNLGIGGATISYDPNRTASNASMYGLLMNDAGYCFGSSAYYNAGDPSGDAEDVDLILLEGGSNDYGPKVGAAQGSAGSKDPATFLGGWYLMTEELLRRYPNAVVVFVTAWENVNQTREDGALAIPYTSSVKTLYTRFYKDNARVYLIDAGDPDVSGVDMVTDDGAANVAFKSQYAYDQYHLNDAGMELMAQSMLPLLWEIVVETKRVERSEVEQMQYDLNALDVLAIGDSLFYGAGNTTGKKVWVNSIGRDCSWNLTNLGIGGATISYNPDIAETRVSMYDRLFHDESYKFGSREDSRYYNTGNTIKDKEDVDVILLEGGSNDYGTKVQAPMGTVDSTDPATFLGGWRLMTEELLRQYPNAIVIFVTAWENGDQPREDGANAVEFTSSVVTLYNEVYADNDRVYLIDAGNPEVSGVDMRSSTFKSLYAYDSFHLNDDGMALMAKSMLPLIWDVVKNQANIR